MRKCMSILTVMLVIVSSGCGLTSVTPQSDASENQLLEGGKVEDNCSDRAVLYYFSRVARGATLSEVVTEKRDGNNIFCSASFVYPKSNQKYVVYYVVQLKKGGEPLVKVIRYIPQ